MCHEYGISFHNYSNRRRKGWSVEEALTTPIEKRQKKATDHLGNSYKSISEMCHKYGISRHLYSNRRHRGWGIEEALTTPTSR